MAKTVDLLDSANQKFDPGASGMTSSNAQDGIVEAFNTVEVAKDTTPALGGDLDLDGNNILITNPSDGLEGAVGLAPNNTDVFFVHANVDGGYNSADGGILCRPGVLELGGSVVEIPSFKGADNRDVQVSSDGVLYAAPLPEPGWEVSDTSTFNHNFGNGKTQGPWVEVVGLEVNPGDNITTGDRVDVYTELYVENTEDKAGAIEIGIGVNGADPTVAGANSSVGPDSISYIPVSWLLIAGADYTTADTFTVFARRAASQDDAHLYLRGTTQPHTLIVSVPGEGGGSGGSPTNLGNTLGPSTVTITSSTGANTVIPGAVSGTAGVMTGAQVDLLNNRAVGLDSVIFNNDVGLEHDIDFSSTQSAQINMVANDDQFSHSSQNTREYGNNGTSILFTSEGPTNIARVNPAATGVLEGISPSGQPPSITAFGAIGATHVMVGTSQYIGTSTDQGDTWTARTNPSSDNMVSLDDDGTTIIAVGGTNPDGRVLTSTDGITWTDQGTGGSTTSAFSSVKARSTGNFIAVNENGDVYRSTNSGANWTAGASLTSSLVQKPIWDGTRWLFVCNDGSIYQSNDDGATITLAYNAQANGYSGPRLAWDGTTYYLTGTNENPVVIATSVDLSTWVDQMDWINKQDAPLPLFDWIEGNLWAFGDDIGASARLPSTLDDVEILGSIHFYKVTGTAPGKFQQFWHYMNNPNDTYTVISQVCYDITNMKLMNTLGQEYNKVKALTSLDGVVWDILEKGGL